jgi:hypothetical protein
MEVIMRRVASVDRDSASDHSPFGVLCTTNFGRSDKPDCLSEILAGDFIWPVDNKVGNVRNAGPDLILPLEEP